MSENPYSAPTSDVSVRTELKRSIFWKVYFFILILLSIVGYVEVYSNDGAGFAEALSLLISIFSTVGLFGFVFSKKILWASVWLPILILSIAYSVVYIYIANVDLSAGMDRTTYIISQAIGWGISIPAYIGLFLYSRPTNPIWQNPSNKALQPNATEPSH